MKMKLLDPITQKLKNRVSITNSCLVHEKMHEKCKLISLILFIFLMVPDRVKLSKSFSFIFREKKAQNFRFYFVSKIFLSNKTAKSTYF